MHSQHEDGNMKLFRWRRDYEPNREVYYPSEYLFVSDDDVQAYMQMIDIAMGKKEVKRTCQLIEESRVSYLRAKRFLLIV